MCDPLVIGSHTEPNVEPDAKSVSIKKINWLIKLCGPLETLKSQY